MQQHFQVSRAQEQLLNDTNHICLSPGSSDIILPTNISARAVLTQGQGPKTQLSD